MMPRGEHDRRLLILAPFGKDAIHLSKVLGAHGNFCTICRDIDHLCEELKHDAGVILTTEEVLASRKVETLKERLTAQPTWSAISLLVFYSPQIEGEAIQRHLVDKIGNVTSINFLPRPVTTTVILNAVNNALRDRGRQYRTRDLLAQLQADIEQREQYESQLKVANERLAAAKVQAEEASHSKSQFLANMSHEIRTPLGAIMGFADLMVQSDVAPAQIERYVAVIRRNSSQLLRIIDDILDLSKVEAGKMVIERVPFSLIELLDDVSTMLGLRARESSIAYSMHLQPPFPESVISDPTRLRQILMNVIGNAIKFTHRGSVTFIASYAAGVLSFEVKDTGHGISTEQSQFLFKPFAQADTSTTRKFGGTGLGLVLTRKLCEAMGGTFYLKESALGVGSTFVAQVKAEAVKTKRMIELDYRPHAHLMGSEELRGADVLLVEDSTDNQELIRILLTNAGAKVEIAGNGRIGVQKALAHPYSVILMDVQMPEMDGVEALSIMRKHGVEVPIIALTAHAMKIERDRCLRAGFSEFLSKPVNRDDLVRQILATS